MCVCVCVCVCVCMCVCVVFTPEKLISGVFFTFILLLLVCICIVYIFYCVIDLIMLNELSTYD